MEDYNSPEEDIIPSIQEDPIVMYLIVKESLAMSIGKTAAQCAHASQMLIVKYFKMLDELDGTIGLNRENKIYYLSIFEKWLNTSFRKVVLSAKNKDWQKIKEICPNHIVVVDAGLTEIAPESETVIGLFPMYKSKRPKLIQRLQVLK